MSRATRAMHGNAVHKEIGMNSLDAYHLSGAMTQADRNERNRMDKTCLACGYFDEVNHWHDCPTGPALIP